MGPLIDGVFEGLEADYLQEFRRLMTKYAFSGPAARFEYSLVDCFDIERVSGGYAHDTNRTVYGIDRVAGSLNNYSGHIGLNAFGTEFSNTFFFPVVDGIYTPDTAEPQFLFFDIFSVFSSDPVQYLFVGSDFQLPDQYTSIGYPFVMEDTYILINNEAGYSGFDTGLSLSALVITDEIFDQEVPAQPPVDVPLNFECSLVPEAADLKQYLLGLPFADACNLLNNCVQEEMQSRLNVQ